MKTRDKIWLVVLVVVAVLSVAGFMLYGKNFAVLNPKGTIAHQERGLIIFAGLLSLVVVIPVFVMTTVISLKYREGNPKAKYSPDWDHNLVLETTWWLVPAVLILILSVVTWRSTHELDPFKPIVSNVKPITIQVIALDWKWLFIYPQQNIASVNYIVIPENTPVDFQITADAPMNSFWIPQLSGQIYAMSGMSTELHLEADGTGTYVGRSANISGEGFSGMQFKVNSVSDVAFDGWVRFARQAPQTLSMADYNQLAQPSLNNAVSYYSSTQNYLYDQVVFRTMPDANTFGASL